MTFRAKLFRPVVVALLASGLAGCVMNAPPSRGGVGAQALMPDLQQSLAVKKVNVIVPRSLRVSEDNTYKPSADIVWHGEAEGDRYAQVDRIVRAAMTSGTAGFRSGRAVIVDVQITRFHALTPKTRASIGGKHELEYMLTLRDAVSGAVIRMVPNVSATVRGAGGAAAQAEEAAGRSQAVVIREALIASIQKELGQDAPSGSASGAPSASAAGVARAANDPAQAALQ